MRPGLAASCARLTLALEAPARALGREGKVWVVGPLAPLGLGSVLSGAPLPPGDLGLPLCFSAVNGVLPTSQGCCEEPQRHVVVQIKGM